MKIDDRTPNPNTPTLCPICEGRRYVYPEILNSPDSILSVPCPLCNGEGYIFQGGGKWKKDTD
jgi:hypothetical protein